MSRCQATLIMPGAKTPTETNLLWYILLLWLLVTLTVRAMHQHPSSMDYEASEFQDRVSGTTSDKTNTSMGLNSRGCPPNYCK